MRLYQPYGNIERKATQDCVVPLRYPVIGKDGQPIDSVVVTKGTEVWIGKQLGHREAPVETKLLNYL